MLNSPPSEEEKEQYFLSFSKCMNDKEKETQDYWQLVHQVAGSNLQKYEEKEEKDKKKKKQQILDETPDTEDSIKEKIKSEVRTR